MVGADALATAAPATDHERSHRVTEWQPIETAPMDGTKIDIWVADQDGDGRREADAYWVKDRAVDPYDSTKGCRDGWWAPNHDYDGADGWAMHRPYTDRTGKEYFERATHWMPRPPPPTTGA
jgi:hypothetical protein